MTSPRSPDPTIGLRGDFSFYAVPKLRRGARLRTLCLALEEERLADDGRDSGRLIRLRNEERGLGPFAGQETLRRPELPSAN
jgi:hypothetical protein